MAAFADPTDARATPDPVPDAATARQWLDAEERRLVTLLGQIRHDASASGDTGDATAAAITQHPADQGTETFTREVDATLAADLTAELHEVAQARLRLDAGRYGRCERCHEPIVAARLEAMPATRYCLRHEERYELGGRHLEDLTSPARRRRTSTDAVAAHVDELVELLPDDEEYAERAVEDGPEAGALTVHDAEELEALERLEQLTDDELDSDEAVALRDRLGLEP